MRPKFIQCILTFTVNSDGHWKAFQKLDANLSAIEGRILDLLRQKYDNLSGQLTTLNRDLSQLVREQERQVHEDALTKLEARIQLFETWRMQNEASIRSIVDTIDQQEEERRLRKYQRKVLDTLYFEKIDDRQNMIDEKHAKTLQWVFDPPANSQWSRVPDWLRGSDALYWITGKAGSGKSTFVKWLYGEEQTRALLQEWAGSRELLVAKYFFWISSKTAEQKSLSGLLRSVLYDLLQTRPELIPKVSPYRWRSHDLELVHFPAWTEKDLVGAIQVFIECAAQRSCICIFIDGLDEFDGKYHQRIEVIKLLKNLSSLPTIKICVSSRDWEEFKQAFGAGPKLQLEYLTKKDIEDYINTELALNDTFQALCVKDSELCSQLVIQINYKAKGVWLWVILVVRSLLQGLGYQDSAEDLLDRLRAIPEDLEAYFLQMFSNIDRFYLPKALKLFKLALEGPDTVSVMSASFIDEGNKVSDYHAPIKSFTKTDIYDRVELARTHVNVRCMGLLECMPLDSVFGGYTLEFLHRTARDFLDQPTTKELVAMGSVAAFNVDLFLCEAALAQVKMLELSDSKCITGLCEILDEVVASTKSLELQAPEDLLPILRHLEEAVVRIGDASKSSNTTLTRRGNLAILAWTKNIGLPSPLLPLCIQLSLSSYAKETLLANPGLVRVRYDRPLLDMALRRGAVEEDLPYSYNPSTPEPQLVEMILKRGADPNEDLSGLTVWKHFLKCLDEGADDIYKYPQDEKQKWIDVCELCIRYGAVRVVESRIHIPNQSSGRTRVKLTRTEKLAKDSFRPAFGSKEAARLDLLASRLQMTGVNMVTWSMRKMGVGFGG